MNNNFINWKSSNIKLEINPDTKSIVYKNPGSRYKNKNNLPRNRYGNDDLDYCRFRCSDLPDSSGVYALFIIGEDKPVYIGRAINLKKRWSYNQYGSISPRNCFKGGQATNCKINNYILRFYLNNPEGTLILRYFVDSDYIKTEKALINKYSPELNNQLKLV